MYRNTKKELFLLQVLRGIASTLVLLFHVNENMLVEFNVIFFRNIFKFGSSGVDLFFVLSGFIIAYTNKSHIHIKKNWVSYIKKRIIRIYPIYWVVILFFLGIQLLLPEFYKTGFSFTLYNIFSTLFLFPNHFMVNGVSWSLSYELFFYLMFISLFFFKKKAILWSFIAYTVCLFFFNFFLFQGSSYLSVWEFIFSPMNLEFIGGVIIGNIYGKISLIQGKRLLSIGIILFVISASLVNAGIFIFGSSIDRVIFFGWSSFLIVLGIVAIETKITIEKRKINKLVLLGDASYSLYLIHLPILVAAFKIYKFFDAFAYLNVTLFACFVSILIVLSGIFFYIYIEKPLVTSLRKI